MTTIKEQSEKVLRAKTLENRPQRLAKLARTPIVGKSWQSRTKQRVKLLVANEQPNTAKEFVELFTQAFGADKLPYLWVSTAETKSGRPSTLFRKRFGPVSPDKSGLRGYTIEEEQRRIDGLRVEK